MQPMAYNRNIDGKTLFIDAIILTFIEKIVKKFGRES